MIITAGENFTLQEGNTLLIIENLNLYDNGHYQIMISRQVNLFINATNITTSLQLEIIGTNYYYDSLILGFTRSYFIYSGLS